MKSLRRLLGRGLVCRRTELHTGSGAPYASRRLLLLDSSATSTLQNRSASSALPSFKVKSTSIPPFHSSKWDLLRGLSLVGINGTPRYVTGRELSGMGMIEFSHTFGSLSKRTRNINVSADSIIHPSCFILESKLWKLGALTFRMLAQQ